MKETTNNTEKLLKSSCGGIRGLYIAPHIELITLDNDVALILESSPPIGPSETREIAVPDFFQNNYFKDIQA